MSIIFIRTLIMYLIIIISVRLMGRRQVGELQPSELVITMLISNLASLPMQDKSLPLLTGILPILVLVCFEIFMSFILKDSANMRKLICGSPKIIIQDGKINQKVMKELRFSIDDLIEALRQNNIFDFTEVDCAIAETTGQLSIFKKYDFQEKQNTDFGKSKSCPSFVIINDGKIEKEALSYCNIDINFIQKALKGKNIKNILIMICNKNKKFTIVEKE